MFCKGSWSEEQRARYRASYERHPMLRLGHRFGTGCRREGGRIVGEGIPEEIARENTPTGIALRAGS